MRHATIVRRSIALFVLALAVATRSRACQDRPRVACDLVAERPFVVQGQPFRVFFTITNMQTPPTVPPTVLDDLTYAISAQAFEALYIDPGGREACVRADPPVPVLVDPPMVSVVLDDALSPHADDPTTWTGSFLVTPSAPADAYTVWVWACAPGGSTSCVRECYESVCVQAIPEPSILPTPTASFDEPVRTGPAGSQLPFAIRVHRNGYDPSRPLTVKVDPENFSDFTDLLPIAPATLRTVGAVVTGDDELVHFTCMLKFPCFEGVANSYHVSISDGPLLLWESRRQSPRGIGVVRVDDSPMAHLELVEVLDDSGDGKLSSCEPGRVHLRLHARDPYVPEDLEDVRLELALPPSLQVESVDTHFFDNPMDGVTQPPAVLAAGGTTTVSVGSLTIDVDRIEDRFETFAPPGVPVFRDLFQAEVILATPPLGLDGGSLSFAPLTVSGTADGVAKLASSQALEVVLDPPIAPREVARPGAVAPLRWLADKRTLTWEPGVVSRSRTFQLFRGEIHELPHRNYGRCLASRLTEPTYVDDEPPPRGDAWFYLVRGESCGEVGTGGADSLGATRELLDPCP